MSGEGKPGKGRQIACGATSALAGPDSTPPQFNSFSPEFSAVLKGTGGQRERMLSS